MCLPGSCSEEFPSYDFSRLGALQSLWSKWKRRTRVLNKKNIELCVGDIFAAPSIGYTIVPPSIGFIIVAPGI